MWAPRLAGVSPKKRDKAAYTHGDCRYRTGHAALIEKGRLNHVLGKLVRLGVWLRLAHRE